MARTPVLRRHSRADQPCIRMPIIRAPEPGPIIPSLAIRVAA